MIHVDSVNDVYSKRVVPLWLISAFKAGFINSAGFLITGKFVSHVTGFGTQVGIAVGHEDYFFGVELLVIPLSFIFGGVITSWFLDRSLEKGEYPPYWKVQSLITLLLTGVILSGEFFFTNSEVFPFDLDNKYTFAELAFISSLCLACGLKNSLVTWSTFGKIRVTHLTGLSTDIGLNLLRTLSPNWKSVRFKEERYVNVLRMMTFVAFSTGALLSALLYQVIGIHCLVIPLAISICMSLYSFADSKARRVKSLVDA